ncbi:hypothetical protein Sjap_001624 [Stephania japonica]|uniref:Uncharacterized protein n=1 Tax=Stephania japonica TaxID=461633 RepID=A0AAP0KM22_9MAGN
MDRSREMETLDLSLIETGGSDDSLIEQDLNLMKSSRSDDLHNVVDAGAIHFECSPLQTHGFKRSYARRLVPPIELSKIDEISGPVEGVGDKENLDEKNLSAENSKKQMKMRRKVKGYNLRKSLAWNSAFFTEEGVLDSSELSTLCDKSIRESKTSTLSSISEETSAPMPKSGDTSLRKPSNEGRKLAGALSRKARTASQKSVASTPSKAQVAKGIRIASNGGGCPRPPASSSQKKPLNSNLGSAPVVNSRLPKPPLPKFESSTVSSNKYAGTGARGLSSNLNIPSGSVQKSVVFKGRNSTKVASGIASSSSKPMLLRSGKNLQGKSSSPAPVPTNSKLSQASKHNNGIAEKKVLNPALLGDKPAPINGTGLSGFVEPPVPNNNDRGGNTQTAQFQPAKPTGLRMPSPSLGFFDQKKASASPVILSPRGAHPSNLGEDNNPTFQNLNTPSRNSETRRPTPGTMRLPREGTGSTKHRAVTSKDRIPSNTTSHSKISMKLNLEPNNLLTKLRSDFNPSTINQTNTQQGSQVIQENSVGVDEQQMVVTKPNLDELDHISKDENKVVLAQSGSSLQDQNNAHLETSEVTDLQGSSSTGNESEFLRTECQVNSEMPVKVADNLLGHKKEYTGIESTSVDSHDGISSTDVKDDAGVKDALVVDCGFSEIGVNGGRQSAGAETREVYLHDVNETKHEWNISDAPPQMNSQMHASKAGNLMETDSGIGIQAGFLISNSVGNENVVAACLMNDMNQSGLKTLVPGDHCCRVSCDTDGGSEQQAELRNPKNESEKVLFDDSPGNLISTQEDREAKGRLMPDSDVRALLDPVVQLKESYSGGQSGIDAQMEAFHSLHNHLSDENHDINFVKRHMDEKISSCMQSDSIGVAKDVGEPGEKQSEHIETSSDEVVQILSKCDPELLTHDKILLNEGVYSEQYAHEDKGNLLLIQSSTPELPKDNNIDNATNFSSERRDSSVPSIYDSVTNLNMEDDACLISSSNNQPVENQESIDGKLSDYLLSENYDGESSLRPVKDQTSAINGSEEDYMLTDIVGSGISPSCKSSNGSSRESNCSKLIQKRKSLDSLMPDARVMKPKLNDLPRDELLAALEEAQGEETAPASPTVRSPRDTDSCSLVGGIDSTKYGDVASRLISKCPTPSIMTSLSHLARDSNLEPNYQTFRSPNLDRFDHMSRDENTLAEKNSVQRSSLQDQSNTHLENSEDVHSQGISSDQTKLEFSHTECQVNSEIQVERVGYSIASRNGEDTVIEPLSVDNHDSTLEIGQDGDRQSGQAESREITLHDVNETKHEPNVFNAPLQMSPETHGSKAGKESHLAVGVEIGLLTSNAVDHSDVVSELHFSEAVNHAESEVLASDCNFSRGSCDTDGESEQQAQLGSPPNESEEVMFEDVHEEQNGNVSAKQKRPMDGSWEYRNANGRLMPSSDVSAPSTPALQLKESDRGEPIRIEDNQMEALQFNSFDMHDDKLDSSVPNASLGVPVDTDEQGAQQSEPLNTSSVEVEQILFQCDHELQKHEKIWINDDRHFDPSQEDNVGIKSSASEQLPKDHNLEKVTNSSSERLVFSAACDGSVMHSHTVDMCLNSSSNNLPIEVHETTKDELLEHLFRDSYEAESSFISRSDHTSADNRSEENYTSSKITGLDLSPSSKSSNSGSPMQGHSSKSINKRKSLDDVEPDGRAMKPKLNAVPFSEEWLAALEAAGEDILTMKSGAVQNSPPEKSASEPNPWSPVKRKNNEEIGPFHCTKYTTLLQPPHE